MADFNLLISETADSKWDEFRISHQGLIFSSTRWGQVLKDGLGARALYLWLEDSTGNRLAQMLAAVITVGPFRICYCSIPYGGIDGASDLSGVFVGKALEALRELGVDQMRLLDSPVWQCTRLGVGKKIATVSYIAGLEDLTKEMLWAGYRKGIRQRIRVSRRAGVEVHAVHDRKRIPEIYSLYLASLARNRAASKYPLSWFLALYDLIVTSGHGDILAAFHNGTPVAMIVVVYSPPYAHYLHGGSHTQALKLCPNDALFHSALELSIERGIKKFDFLSTAVKDTELRRFKEKWGGTPIYLNTHVIDVRLLRSKLISSGLKLMNSPLGRIIADKFRHITQGYRR